MNKLNDFFSTFTAKKFEQFTFFLTVLLLPSQLGKHFWPDFASIFSIRTDYYSPRVYFWDLLVLILIIGFFYNKNRFKRAPLFLFLVFCLSQLISLFSAANLGAGLVRLEQYLIVGLFGVYVASQTFQHIRTPLYFGLLGAICYSGVIALLQVMQGGTLGLWILGERNFSLDTISIATFDWYGQVFLRAYATFPHPNVLAAFMVIAVSLIIWLSEQQKLVKYYGYEWLGFVIGSAGMLLTFSRVALVFYAVVFAYILKNKLKLFGLIVLFLLPFLYVRFNSAFNFDQLSFIRREELAVQSYLMIKEAPLFGVGLNNFIHQMAYHSPVSGEIRFMQPVHNIFLLNLAETGVLGSIGFSLFLLFALFTVYRSGNKILLFVWVSIFGMGLFDHYFLTLAQGQRLLFLVWGLSVLEYEHARNA